MQFSTQLLIPMCFDFCQIQLLVTDQRNPPRTATAQARVSITRDRFPPEFTNLNNQQPIGINQAAPFNNFFTIRGQDQDLRVSDIPNLSLNMI